MKSELTLDKAYIDIAKYDYQLKNLINDSVNEEPIYNKVIDAYEDESTVITVKNLVTPSMMEHP